MTTLKFKNVTAESMEEVFKQILDKAGGRKVFVYDAVMGMGKTTLTITACKVLGVTSTLSSPTYSIINEYETSNGNVIYHIDCYRLKHLQEAIDAGVGECIESGHYCFIEWADLVEPIWPEKYVRINIKGEGEVRDIEVAVV